MYNPHPQVILSFIQSFIGEQPRDILLGAADEVLTSIKSNPNKEDQMKEVKDLLGDLPEER